MCHLTELLGQVQELLAAQREAEGQGFDIWDLWEGRNSISLHSQVLYVYRSKEKFPL